MWGNAVSSPLRDMEKSRTRVTEGLAATSLPSFRLASLPQPPSHVEEFSVWSPVALCSPQGACKVSSNFHATDSSWEVQMDRKVHVKPLHIHKGQALLPRLRSISHLFFFLSQNC